MSIILRAGGWTSPPATVASRFRDRWRGLRPYCRGRGLLLRGRSVHGIGMRESLWVIGLDDNGTVVDVRLLLPRWVVRMAEATWLLEIAATEEPPPIGSALEAVQDRY